MTSAAELIAKLPAAYTGEGSDCIVQFTNQGKHVVIAGGTCTVGDGANSNADLGISMEDDDLVALMKGELNGMTAFMTGKLQLDGNMMLAQQLTGFFDPAKL
jgi:putative sterol carrier protein